MTNRRRQGKPHKPFVPVSPLVYIQPVPAEIQAGLLGRFQSALHMLATYSAPGPEEFRDIADAINTVETLCLELGKLVPDEVMPLVNAAVQAMAEAGNRWHAGQRMGLSGPGLQAVRDVIDVYGQAMAGLTGAEMARARVLTEQRVRAVLAGKKVNGREVIAV